VKSIVAVTLVAVLLITAVAGVILVGSHPASAAPPPFRSVRVGVSPWTVTTFNPLKITLVDEYIVVYSVYSTLLTNDKSYSTKGDLAYAWDLAPDNVTWTFHLAHGAYFVDPTNPADTSHPVRASDVKYSYELQMNQTASILHVYTDDIQSVNVVDDYTVQIITKGPVATMSSTANNLPILPEYVWNVPHQDPMKFSPNYPIGSGGFYYDTTNSTATIAILRKSPHYYADQYYCSVIKPDEVRFISYTSGSSMVQSFTSGADALNTIVGIDPTSYTNALAGWNPKFAVDQGFVGEYAINLMTDAQRAALVAAGTTQFRNGVNNQLLAMNWTVRRAIAMSIDKPTLIQDALLGLGNVGDSLVPDTNNWHYQIPSQYLYQFDPAAARAMLNAAGWTYDSTGALNAAATPLYQKGASNGTLYWPLIFKFYTLNTEPWWQAAAADITHWLSLAGIQTTDKLGNTVPGYGLYNINTMSGYWLSADYDMWLWDWVFTPASDPSTDILEVETTAAIGPTSDNFYSNTTFDALYNASVTTVDPVARRAILNEMQLMVYNESSYIIPFYKDDLYAATNDNPGGAGWAWQNWGNWSRYNGLTPDSDLLNLWMQIDPADDPAPIISSFPQVQWINTTAASVGVTVSDPLATILNYTFDFGDGTAPVTTQTVPVQHLFAQPGNYTIKLRVTNAEWPACGSTAATIVTGGPGSSVNLPPQVASFGPSASTALVNQKIWFNLSVSDPEGDNLTAVWSFGDGSATTTSYADSGTLAGVKMSQTHTYPNANTYEVTVTVTDNETYPGFNHSPRFFTNVTVEVQSSTPTGGGGAVDPLIAYGIPLLIIAVVVIAVVAVMMRRRSRAKKEDQETTEEEARRPPSPPPPP